MTTVIDPRTLEALLWDAFEGEPGTGCREVRLASEEADYLHTACPAARLSILEGACGEGKSWYLLDFTQACP